VLGKENCTVGALRQLAEGWDVSIKARGIKATGVGAAGRSRRALSRVCFANLARSAAPTPVALMPRAFDADVPALGQLSQRADRAVLLAQHEIGS